MSPQQTIAHYRVTSKLGEGGMGEVWRATDTKLNRDVAIKILPPVFAQDPDRMARFAREAQVLASLNHPNIAQIYGVEERALVMELVEGEPLKGPLPLETALDYARQIADALEAAHEKGIVHRDLKPANVLVTPGGVVKVLDFGLAKAAEEPSGNVLNSPTLTLSPTHAGFILGTAPYMAPEQARGKAVDKRADIWAFGCVLYETLTGRRAFTGETTTDILAAVVTKEPDLTKVPPEVRRVIESCLKKDPKQRLQAIGDWRLLLDSREAPVAQPQARPALWIGVAATLAVALIAAGVLLWNATRPVDHPLTRLTVDLGPNAMAGLNLTVAISPDGRRLVFPARGPDGKQRLATRLLDQAQATLLPGTEEGRDPFFSPDSQWIGFFAEGQLKKISVQGGAPVTLVSIGNVTQGASWGEDGNIILEPGGIGPLSRIPAAGGTMQRFTTMGPGEVSHHWPQVLPGLDAVLFSAASSASGTNNANIETVSTKTSQVKVLVHGGYHARYLPSGHLVYVHQGSLYGVKFDPKRLELIGSPVLLLDDLAANPVTGGGQFDFSNNGTFVYASDTHAVQRWQVAWLDNSGKTQSLLSAPGLYSGPRLSPDGRKLAISVDGANIYIYDLERGVQARLTSISSDIPVWSVDSKHVLFVSGSGLFWTRADGAGDPQLLLASANSPRPWSLSGDGKRLAYFIREPDTGYDLWTVALDLTDPDHPKAGRPEPFLRTPADELIPEFSFDGNWIAYRSLESGPAQIYVRPFPATKTGKWQVSTDGGLYALWSKNGRELFYETIDNRIMVVDYKVDGDSFIPGKPRLWSDKQLFYTGTWNLDLAPDGKRFVVLAMPDSAAGAQGPVHVTMLLNFFDELKRRIP